MNLVSRNAITKSFFCNFFVQIQLINISKILLFFIKYSTVTCFIFIVILLIIL